MNQSTNTATSQVDRQGLLLGETPPAICCFLRAKAGYGALEGGEHLWLLLDYLKQRVLVPGYDDRLQTG